MNNEISNISQYIQAIQSVGRYSFSFEEISEKLGKTDPALRESLKRLIQKNSIANVRQGFYVIIPPEYSNMGMLPVEFYIDFLMKYLKKDYYVGLLSAAMFHGAAHQQPQIFNVVIKTPMLRPIEKEKINILFSKRNIFPENGIEQKKTDTGYFKISSPELTFLDLIHFEQHIGGFNKIITILKELIEEISINNLKNVLQNDFPVTVFQRAGYIADRILKSDKIASVIKKRIENEKYRSVLLKATGEKKGIEDAEWKVIVNINIESDL